MFLYRQEIQRLRADVRRNQNMDHLYQHNLMRSVSGHNKMVMRCSFQLACMACMVSLTKLDIALQSQVHVCICLGQAYWQDPGQGKDGVSGTGGDVLPACALHHLIVLDDAHICLMMV